MKRYGVLMWVCVYTCLSLKKIFLLMGVEEQSAKTSDISKEVTARSRKLHNENF
jgi:hypothetical protein